ncbi:MAG: type II toxin-antitoxin system HicB family antitoxin [Sphaerospermopsis sp. SIO1G2]|nr:type II toxin-antitoxin system HicB family antitoxin [Sphaerospermopsis sp. SIO1G2]
MIEYTVIYECGDKNWSAYVPDLPGCVACGDTLQETEELIKEAIELYLEVLKENRKPIPKPSTIVGKVAVNIER